jgi:lysyl-tRNA synthetase class I
MKILNTTTGQIEELNHDGYECDCVPDLVADDNQITWNDELEIRQADEDAIDWWRDYLAADAKFMAAKAELRAELDEDDREELETDLQDAMGCDMGDQPAAGMSVLKKWAADRGTKLA